MKKLVLLICLFAATAVQAQTKEETRNFLLAEGNALLGLRFKVVSDCGNYGKIFIVGYELKMIDDSGVILEKRLKTLEKVGDVMKDEIERDTIQFNNVLYQDIPDDPLDEFNNSACSGSGIVTYKIKHSGGGFWRVYADKTNPQNALRVVKAINYMAKLCGAKPYKKLFE